MIFLLAKLGEALLIALGMFWEVGWSLVLGFTLSGLVQALVSNRRMREQLGRDGWREIALATIFGAASSSCSYAAAALSKTIFKKGAALIPSLAFLFSSTNLVIELGVVLWVLMGWQFALAEWCGGVLLVGIMSGVVKLTYPRKLVEEARRRVEQEDGHDHDAVVEGDTLVEKLRNPRLPIVVAQHFTMDWSMLQQDLLLGFLIAGLLAAFVPDAFWHRLFLNDAPAVIRVPADALIGPLVAVFTFVCSIGNVPMAAVLWAGGAGFGGVLAFLYADLIVLPLLDVYRRYYGWRMAAYIGGVFYLTTVLAAIAINLTFAGLGLVPQGRPAGGSAPSTFPLDATFWLNLAAAALVVWFVVLSKRNPMHHHHTQETTEAPG
ncbi:MAG: permease [Candidatus Eremiobacteraeota bacterium]|nr:permease [Candidatus Eremiobacteraeota bacterium]